MLNIIGWIGSIAFSLCAVPQAIKSIKEKHSDGVSLLFLILWIIGEACSFIYVWPSKDLPLLVNYFNNLVFTLTILWYKIYPHRDCTNLHRDKIWCKECGIEINLERNFGTFRCDRCWTEHFGGVF